eukprot:3380927-Rhodomonas_salina.1
MASYIFFYSKYQPPIVLRTRYSISGIDIGYATTSGWCCFDPAWVASPSFFHTRQEQHTGAADRSSRQEQQTGCYAMFGTATGYQPTPRNRIQETAFSVQFVPGM